MIPKLNHDPSTCQACWDKGVTGRPPETDLSRITWMVYPDPLRPVETDEEPWAPTDPPGFSMTGGDVFVLASVVAVSWAAVILGVLLVRRIWR